MPAKHAWPAAHTRPHSPQFGSASRLTQEPEHDSCGTGHSVSLEPAATKPSLKCVTLTVAKEPAIVAASRSYPGALLRDQKTAISELTAGGANGRLTVTGCWKLVPAGPHR